MNTKIDVNESKIKIYNHDQRTSTDPKTFSLSLTSLDVVFMLLYVEDLLAKIPNYKKPLIEKRTVKQKKRFDPNTHRSS